MTEQSIIRILLESLSILKPRTRQGVLRALEEGNIELALAELRWGESEEFLRANLPIVLRGTMETSAAEALKIPGLSLSFDVMNPRAVDWVRGEAGSLITEWGATNRQALQILLTRSFEQGRTVQQTARSLFQEGIGLHPRYVNAVNNYRIRLEEAAAAGKKITALQIDGRVQRYHDKLVRLRTRNIARTETMRALNQGSLEAWTQQVENGKLPPGTEREWIWHTGEDFNCGCPEMNGKRAKIGEPFEGGVWSPPLHPSCRCTTGIVRPR